MRHASFLFLLSSLALHAETPPPEAIRKDGVPRGKLTQSTFRESKIFPGTTRDYWVYVPAQYDASKPAALMVFQDGGGFCKDDWGARAPIVFDNLIAKDEMPVTIGIFINPGVVPAPNDQAEARYNRSYEYDGMGDAYARFLIEEMIPHVAKTMDLRISDNPDDRAICGASSGAIAAFTAAWERPDAFRRVYSMIGTFVALRGGDAYPNLIRKTEPKPLRIFLQDGSADQNIYGGDWWMANQTMERALAWAGYEVNHAWGEGGHSQEHGAAIFPEVMRWLWKDHSTVPVATHWENANTRAMEYLEPGQNWEVVTTGHDWSEGMAVAADGTFFFTDVPGNELFRITPDGTQTRISDATGNANGIALGPDGKTLYTASSGAKQIRAYDTSTGEFKIITEGTTSNDIIVSHSGHLYYTDPPAEKVWHVNLATGERTEADPSFKNPNGIGMSADQTLLFVAHFPSRFVYSYSIATDGTLSNKQPYFYAELPLNSPEGHLDGMAVTTTGELLVGTEMGVQIFDSPGRVQLILPRPSLTDNRTNYVTFGGPDGKTLYVATRETIYKRRVKLQGAHAWEAPIKPPKPKL
jgi:gluconolactonase